jgi:hypothetical protein
VTSILTPKTHGGYKDIDIRSWHSSRAISYRMLLHRQPPFKRRGSVVGVTVLLVKGVFSKEDILLKLRGSGLTELRESDG